MPLRRVEAILGCPVESVDESALDRLVQAEATEDSDLEFKRELYGRNDAGKHELAKDVAAMANLHGGLVVIGVIEEDGAASMLSPVGVSEEEILRMRQVIASSVAPMPSFDVRRIVAEETGEVGYVLLIMQRTAAAPHAVTRNHYLAYPRRDGPRTRWLHESEISDAYRSRFFQAREQQETLAAVHAAALREVSPEDGWLAVSLVPEVHGDAGRGLAGLRRASNWWDERVPLRVGHTNFDSLWGHQLRVGLRKYVASDRHLRGEARSHYLHAEMHRDGSATFATATWADSEHGFPVQWLTTSLITCLGEASAFAVDVAGAHGDAAVRVELIAPATDQPRLLTSLNASGSLIPMGEAEEAVADFTLSLDDLTAADPKTKLQSARLVLDDLVGIFGQAENAFIADDGALILDRFNSTHRTALERWVAAHPITET